ncbi:MAG TPA: GspE/PulE family protein, partial [bacterium]|nr:GspE/PulE family protein [bacterium]
RDFKQSILNPYGMILVTGPTGSGKTTTLYSALNELSRPDVNIITVEDPVEYQLPGINQVHVRPEIGLTFANTLRAILRQDPNIIMVGEIRDQETADISVRAALTGHLVLSTLHTNDAPGAIGRLIDMGVEPFLISSSVIMVCAQRLVRRICQSCKEEVVIPEPVLKVAQVRFDDGKPHPFYRGKGCRVCNGTGYSGRVSLIEVLTINDSLRELVARRATATEIKERACSLGMQTLRKVGLMAVKAGVTTLEEVLRETSRD